MTISFPKEMKLYFISFIVICPLFFLHAESWLSLNDQATEKYIAEQYQQAVVLLNKARKKLKKDKTATLVDESAISTNLAASYRALGDFKNAKIFYLKALSGYKKSSGTKTADYANAAANFSIFLSNQGQFQEALQYAEESLQTKTSLTGLIDENVTQSLNTLAYLHFDMGHYDKALAYSQKALLLYKQLDKFDYAQLGAFEAALGYMYRGVDDYENDKVHSLKALEIFNKHAPLMNTPKANTLNELGLIAEYNNNYKKSTNYYRLALIIFKSIYGKGSSNYNLVLGNIADNYVSQKQFTQADKLQQKVLDNLIHIYGLKSRNVAIRYNNYAQSKVDQEDYRAAYPLIKNAMLINYAILGG